MQIEQVKPNKPKVSLVFALTGVVLLVAFIVAVIILSLHKNNPTPFTKHPVSEIRTGSQAALPC